MLVKRGHPTRSQGDNNYRVGGIAVCTSTQEVWGKIAQDLRSKVPATSDVGWMCKVGNGCGVIYR